VFAIELSGASTGTFTLGGVQYVVNLGTGAVDIVQQ
jgi:hypothetical protein